MAAAAPPPKKKDKPEPVFPLNLNVGVMGHVDSGKTSVVKALSTTLSTASLDKAPESKARGMTLDLGFSSFKVPLPDHVKPGPAFDADELQFTLVDCPGHASAAPRGERSRRRRRRREPSGARRGGAAGAAWIFRRDARDADRPEEIAATPRMPLDAVGRTGTAREEDEDPLSTGRSSAPSSAARRSSTSWC